jgi:hypothetical protein
MSAASVRIPFSATGDTSMFPTLSAAVGIGLGGLLTALLAAIF